MRLPGKYCTWFRLREMALHPPWWLREGATADTLYKEFPPRIAVHHEVQEARTKRLALLLSLLVTRNTHPPRSLFLCVQIIYKTRVK